jgi:tRNA(Ile)-lysidine synthase
VIQQWRDHAYLLPARLPSPPRWQAEWDGRAPRTARWRPAEPAGRRRFEQPLQVRARVGGERILLPGRQHSHALKDCLQRAPRPLATRAAAADL